MQRFALVFFIMLTVVGAPAVGQTAPPANSLPPLTYEDESKRIDAGDVVIGGLIALPIAGVAFAIYATTKQRKPVNPAPVSP